jgi:hypothetical protein
VKKIHNQPSVSRVEQISSGLELSGMTNLHHNACKKYNIYNKLIIKYIEDNQTTDVLILFKIRLNNNIHVPLFVTEFFL